MEQLHLLHILHFLLLICTVNSQDCNVWPDKSVTIGLRDKLNGSLYFPEDEAFGEAACVLNYRYTAVPGVVAMPKAEDDVQEILKFANQHNLRVSIKSSGHDFIGRNTEEGSLHINLKNMKTMSVDLTDSESPTGSSMWAQPAVNWGEVYKEADKYKKFAVGGHYGTVALGGYYGGGGHSAVTPSLGLGIDSLLAIRIVTANGTIVHATKAGMTITFTDGSLTAVEDTELFWALRGGGGAFGVVTRYKLALYEIPTTGFPVLRVGYPFVHEDHGDNAKSIFEFLDTQFIGNLSYAQCGGYLIVQNYIRGNPTRNGMIRLTLLFKGTLEEAQMVAEDINQFHPEWRSYIQWTTYHTFLDYHESSGHPHGGSYYTLSRFDQQEDHGPNSGRAGFYIGTMDFYPHQFNCIAALIGGVHGKASTDYDDGSSAVPSFTRTAISQTSCTVILDTENRTSSDHLIDMIRKRANETWYTVGQGSYFNEPDEYLDDWQTEFWGSMEVYARLVNIKNKWDPNGRFYCPKCVGSDTQPGLCERNDTSIIPGIQCMVFPNFPRPPSTTIAPANMVAQLRGRVMLIATSVLFIFCSFAY